MAPARIKARRVIDMSPHSRFDSGMIRSNALFDNSYFWGDL